MKRELVFRLAVVAALGFLVFQFGVLPMLKIDTYHIPGKNKDWAKSKLVIEPGKYDVIVAGDEPEAVAAAVSAANSGAKTLLLYESDNPSGAVGRSLAVNMETSNGEKKNPLNKGLAGRMKDSLGELFSVGSYGSMVEDILKAEKNLEVVYSVGFDSPLLDKSSLAGINVSAGSTKKTYFARRFIDATGDGKILAMCGVPSFKGSEDLNLKESFSPVRLNFEISGIRWDEVKKLAGGNNLRFNDVVGKYESKHFNMKVSDVLFASQGKDRVVVTGLKVYGIDPTDEKQLASSYTEAVSEVKNFAMHLSARLKEFKDAKFEKAADAFYIKEKRHFKGEYVLSVNDILENRNFEDKTALCSYPVKADRFTENKEYVIGKPVQYSIPLGCLIPLNVDNVLMVGSKASYSSLAATSAGMTGVNLNEGEAAGIAAVYSIVNSITPREMLSKRDTAWMGEFQLLLKKQGLVMEEFSIENKNTENWAYPALKQLNFLGLITGGSNNDYGFNNEARQEDLAMLLMNGVYRVSKDKYSLEFDSRLRKYLLKDRLTKEKAGEILLSLHGVKIDGGKYFQGAVDKGFINNVASLNMRDRDVLLMEDVYYLASLNIRLYTGKNIGE